MIELVCIDDAFAEFNKLASINDLAMHSSVFVCVCSPDIASLLAAKDDPTVAPVTILSPSSVMI